LKETLFCFAFFDSISDCIFDCYNYLLYELFLYNESKLDK
jgi:hypothetical protein